jgi:hypothetical protein
MAIKDRSTPACNNSIAAVCRSTCGVTCFFISEGHLMRAIATCLASACCTASALRRLPRLLGNRNCDSLSPCSLIHALSTTSRSIRAAGPAGCAGTADRRTARQSGGPFAGARGPTSLARKDQPGSPACLLAMIPQRLLPISSTILSAFRTTSPG